VNVKLWTNGRISTRRTLTSPIAYLAAQISSVWRELPV